MLSILEVPMVRRQVAPISVETYHAMAELGLVAQRTELIRGVMIEKMSKSPLHEYITNLIYEIARAAAGAGRSVRKEAPLTLADSEPEPDLAVVAGRPEDYRTTHPRTALLVVEVAVSTEELDREKARVYAEAGVAEFWLVLPAAGTVEVFTRPEQGAYREQRTFRRAESFASTVLPELQVAVDTLLA